MHANATMLAVHTKTNKTTAEMVTVSTASTTNSTEPSEDILERLNSERAMYMIPAMIWVFLLMIVGVIGNSLVVYVYRRRFKKTSSNYFILTMAIFDLIACVVGMPTEIYDLNNPYTYYSDIGCKIFRGCETFTVYGSTIVLTEIAFDRYFKICRPLMVVSLSKIKMLCVFAVFLAVCFSIAPLILYGTKRVETNVPGIFGYDCSIAQQYQKTTFQKVFYFALSGLFVSVLVILIVLYTRIWLEIRCRRQAVIGDQLTNTPNGMDARSRRRLRVKYVPSVSEDESYNNSIAIHNRSPSSTELNSTKRSTFTSTPTSSERRAKFMPLVSYNSGLKVTRTTIVLFAVTVAFVLSYLPAIVIMVIRSIVKDYEKNQTNATRVVSKIFSNFFFTNNAINPIIYSFLNVHFRRQAKKTLQKVFCCFIRKRRSPLKLDSDRVVSKDYSVKD